MKWIKISDQFPANGRILYFDGKTIFAAYCYESTIASDAYYCPDSECNWTYTDDCDCNIKVEDDHYWMPFPNQPERLSEKTPQGEATV